MKPNLSETDRAILHSIVADRCRAAVEDDGYNVVVTDRGTGKPLLAVEYGACY